MLDRRGLALSILKGPLASLAKAIPALLAMWLDGKKPTTLRTYGHAMDAFQKFLGAPTRNAAAEQLLSLSHGEANALVLGFKNHLMSLGRAAGTVNNRLSAIRSLVELAKTLGMIEWDLQVKCLRSTPYRDTRGDETEDVLAVFAELGDSDEPTALRDLALLRLIYNQGLRRGEVAALDVSDVDLEKATVRITGKGEYEDKLITISDKTVEAIRRWMARSEKTSPLFVGLDRAGRGRLSSTSIYRIVVGYGLTRPHGLRHSAITRLLDSGKDVRSVQRFSRHRDLRTLQKYDDNRKDEAGELANLLDDDVKDVS